MLVSLSGTGGSLVCDDFSGYKAMMSLGVTEVGCMAHARRKFFELHVANKSQIAEYALGLIGQLYEIERHAKDLNPIDRQHLRQKQARPVADALFEWMRLQRIKVTDGSATAKALDYTLKRWQALTRYLDDGQLPIGRVEMWRRYGRLGLVCLPQLSQRGALITLPWLYFRIPLIKPDVRISRIRLSFRRWRSNLRIREVSPKFSQAHQSQCFV